MKLNQLSKQELNLKLKLLVQKERELLHEILAMICEIDRRRSFLDEGFPSLYEYLTKYIGYSEGAAQRRIDAARLMNQVPELGQKIKDGLVTLNQISLVQKAARKATSLRPTEKNAITADHKSAALKIIQGKSHSESEGAIAKLFALPALSVTKQIRQSDQSVRLELTFVASDFAKLEKVRDHLSHSVLSRDWAELFVHLADKVLAQKLKKGLGPECEYREPANAEKCGSQWQLQKDHVQPKWAGGSDQPTNFQTLCGVHNRLKYRKQAGIKFK